MEARLVGGYHDGAVVRVPDNYRQIVMPIPAQAPFMPDPNELHPTAIHDTVMYERKDRYTNKFYLRDR